MDVEAIYQNDLEFPLPVSDFESGISSPGESDVSDFSFSTSDMFFEDEYAIKSATSILDGGPIYNPFIKVKIEETPKTEKKCCKCGCHDNKDNQPEKTPKPNNDGMSILSYHQEYSVLELFSDSEIVSSVDDFNDIFIGNGYSAIEEVSVSKEVNSNISDNNGHKIDLNSRNLGNKRTFGQSYQKSSDNEEEESDDPSDEEYVPPTPAKKSRNAPTCSVSVSNTGKDERYLKKRQRNNLAAKRSREAKRQREIETVTKTMSLEKENTDLKKQVLKYKKLIAKIEHKLGL